MTRAAKKKQKREYSSRAWKQRKLTNGRNILLREDTMNPVEDITDLVLKTISDVDATPQWLETLKKFREILERMWLHSQFTI
jgi:hypothetical protein